jgi:hypothetical protein
LRRSTTRNPFSVACSAVTLPETAVIPVTSSSGDLSARMRARASSIPPSWSMMTRVGLFEPEAS